MKGLPYQMSDESVSRLLVVRCGGHTCGLKLSQLSEVMRPLPSEPVTGAPEVVQGISVIRGIPCPVVDLGALFGERNPATRLVVVRAGKRRIALAVDKVLGIQPFSLAAFSELPPLVRGAGAGALEAIGALDSELLFVLDSGRLIPDELLASLASEGN